MSTPASPTHHATPLAAQLDGAGQSDAGATYRFGFIMQQVLGHITAYQHFRRSVEQDASVAPVWTEVTYYEPGGRIERLPLLPSTLKGVARAAVQVRRGLARGRYDAVLLTSQALCLWIRGYMRRVPSVIVTDVTPKQFDDMGAFYDHPPARDSLLNRYKHRVNVDVYRSARLLLPWSNWTKQSLMDDYGVPERKIVVVPPGVNVDEWTPPAPGTREASLARAGVPRILFVGGDFARKGGDALLDWFTRHGVGRCELHLVTRQPPRLETELPGLHVHTGLEAGDPRLRALYAECHIFALPTRADCFGVASIEAMATGLPVITTTVGGIPDIIEDGRQGYLVPPDDAPALGARLDSLLSDAVMRQEMGAAGRERVLDRFDAHKNAVRQIALMKELVANGRR
jgi:glycosyltransferase involved in cell wall biosynthesis